MSVIWMGVLALAVPPVSAAVGEGGPAAIVSPAPAASEEKPLVEPRKGVELRKAVHEALRRWARPGDQQADAAARELLVVYRELQGDDQLPLAQREQLRTTVRSRLLKLAEQIGKRVAAEKRLAKDKPPASVDAAAGKGVLGQWGGGFGGMGAGGMGMGGMGGAGMGMGMGGMGGNGQPDDNGEDLIDVIQKTIAPASWDVNGGPGSIYYWRPGFSIVVSNTQEVHEQLVDLLEQLRRAGN